MGILSSVPGLNKLFGANKDSGVGAAPAQTIEGTTSVPANPEAQLDPMAAQTESVQPGRLETDKATLAPDLGETETATPVETQTTAAQPEVSAEQEVPMSVPIDSEQESPASPEGMSTSPEASSSTEGISPPAETVNSPTASKTESQV